MITKKLNKRKKKPIIKKKEKMFRLRTKEIFLTYSQSGALELEFLINNLIMKLNTWTVMDYVLVKELHEDGNSICGKAKILDTPMGKIVKNLIDEGAQLGVSTRGMGSLKSKNGYQEVQEDFMLAAVDIVADPSAPHAFVNGIMEGREWMLVEGSWQERQIDAARKLINGSSSRNLNKNIVKVFEEYFNKLK